MMEFEETSPDTQLVAVGFSKQVGVSELLLKTNPELLVHTMHYPVMHLDEPELADLLALHKVLITRMESDDFISKKAFFCSMMGVMFHLLSKNMRVLQSVESKNSQSQRIGEKFVNLLKQHGKREHDQDFYANKLCVSPKHLAWCVKEATGKTAKQWIDDFVVLEAKSMLKDHAYSISEISQILGFANQSSFGRFFKNATGTSPTDYGSVENGSVENQWG